jgi:hypothetical protein
MKIKILAVFCLVILATACATIPPRPRVITNSWTLDKPFDAAWAAVIESFAELNLPIMNMEKTSGLITTDRMIVNPGYMDCGTIGLDQTALINRGKEYRGRFNVMVKKVADTSATMKVNCTFEVIVLASRGESTTVQCVSTGRLEAEVYKRVSEKLK